MIHGKQVLAFVMAGGVGSRLHPLTEHRCKPSVPFNGRHRLVDFVLSNLVNSEVHAIYLLVQYKSQPLIEHVRHSWEMTRVLPHQFVTVVPPQMQHGPQWFEGTADSVAQNLHLIERLRPDLVAVFGADHVYRMDVRQMVAHHLDTDADATVATLPVPLHEASSFGIVETDARGRIQRFREKPHDPMPMPGQPGKALASMGNYLFDADVLMEELRRARGGDSTDFGQHVLPAMTATHRLMAYDFSTNRIPGLQAGEEPGYWRDVGTIDAYFDAHFDTLGVAPTFNMRNPQWPLFAGTERAESAQIEGAVVRRSTIGSDCIIDGARLDHAILRRSVRIEQDARVERSIVMERCVVGAGAQVRHAIIDQDNVIPAGERIGHDAVLDRARFTVSERGVVVVPRAYFGAPGALGKPSTRIRRREPLPMLVR